eukprot:CAMPEP_0176435570 /NCGR_PEP_ID=MMETSP0127-20121128/17406_1 /TAXON_ID=938130 /ORGANISM="Platyophrya macrostoma, Strain WH" /LENGTH=1067 /DNA_ID=CAMNT_0017818633 /DNA_START=88 /DNA_END=3291 /DNA_ORIENTATION=+
MVEPADKSHSRRDRLVEMEKEAQEIWAKHKFYESEPDPKRKKYFLNFPYPYVNGKLHLGHAYSMSKCEFTIRHKRLKGYNTFWPFSFHCTGMPISAAAEKLKREYEEHGENIFAYADKCQAEFNAQVEAYKKDPKNFKFTAKLPQVSILRMSRVPDSEMHKFKDHVHWLHYFPGIGRTDLQRFGLMVDWRRSFITTELNPYYDSFIQWQFHHLKSKGKISFGKRATIYSTVDKQPCADHDRAEGEGAVPQEFTLVKLRCLELPPKMEEALKDKKVFLVAATLRPETMYGQTNCFVLPTGKYGCFEMKDDEVWVIAERSARNMAYQGLTKEPEKWNSLLDVSGEDLIGIPLKAPLSPYEKVYALPMMTISMDKCTGVVTSVPSDSPDDYATLRDLKNKAALREKFKVKDEYVLPFEPVPIIEIPGFGNLIAARACDDFKVNSQNDKAQLELAKELAYSKGFYEGRFIVEEFKGMKVSEAKTQIRDKMINNGEAHIYYEADKKVVSRSGDLCVVTYTDQWLINYGEESWKKKIQEHVNSPNFNPYLESNLNALNEAIDWLKEWGVSRTFGLGSRLAWDKTYLIESLSDSTIYMAYYTVAHLLQSDLEGKEAGPLNISPEHMTLDAWNYVYLKCEYKECPVPKEKLDVLREQFRYFYPWNLRCSAKDLIRNHLTMSLYNHALIWEDEPEMWPRGIWCNGYLLINGEKMSKSLGNFLTIEDCIEKYGADATRMAVADAGDTLDDANFVPSLADNAVLRLWQLEHWVQDVLKNFEGLRSADAETDSNTKFYDTVFMSQLDMTLANVDHAYETMKIRDVLKIGFFDLLSLKEDYKINCGENNMRKDILLKYLETQFVVLYPITPHFCEIMWRKYYLPHLPAGHNKPEYLSNYQWPHVDTEKIDINALRAYQYIKELYRALRLSFDKCNQRRKDKTAPIAKISIIYSPDYYDWQKKVLQVLASCHITEKNEIFDDWKKIFNDDKSIPDDIKKKSLQFGAYLIKEMKTAGKEILAINLPYNEKELVLKNAENIKKEFKATEIELIEADSAKSHSNKLIQQASNGALPGKPQAIFE